MIKFENVQDLIQLEKEASFPDRLPENAGIDTHQTNRALRALELFGQDKSISREEFLAYKYDKQYSKNSHVATVLEKFLLHLLWLSN